MWGHIEEVDSFISPPRLKQLRSFNLASSIERKHIRDISVAGLYPYADKQEAYSARI